MGNLSIRKVDEETIDRLRKQAAVHGVSMEEEARRILKQAVRTPERLGDLAVELFGPRHGLDIQLPERSPHTPLDLDK